MKMTIEKMICGLMLIVLNIYFLCPMTVYAARTEYVTVIKSLKAETANVNDRDSYSRSMPTSFAPSDGVIHISITADEQGFYLSRNGILTTSFLWSDLYSGVTRREYLENKGLIKIYGPFEITIEVNKTDHTFEDTLTVLKEGVTYDMIGKNFIEPFANSHEGYYKPWPRLSSVIYDSEVLFDAGYTNPYAIDARIDDVELQSDGTNFWYEIHDTVNGKIIKLVTDASEVATEWNKTWDRDYSPEFTFYYVSNDPEVNVSTKYIYNYSTLGHASTSSQLHDDFLHQTDQWAIGCNFEYDSTSLVINGENKGLLTIGDDESSGGSEGSSSGEGSGSGTRPLPNTTAGDNREIFMNIFLVSLVTSIAAYGFRRKYH